MLRLGYSATSDDLSLCSVASIKIDRVTGLPPAAHKRITATLSVEQVEQPRWITLRPGLAEGLSFYGVIHGQTGILVCLSDRHQTRYYWFSGIKRETVIIDSPSRSHGQALSNLFRGLVSDDRATFTGFYSSASQLLLSYFAHERIKQSFTVEGFYKQVGQSFIAEVEWDPKAPMELIVSSTLDKEQSRKVSLMSHPIAEVHKQCHR
jgi:hypothetical protein